MNISNRILSVDVSLNGGCITSITDAAGGERITFAGADYWNHCDHVLFPFCGRMNEGYYEYDGKRYYVDIHGFAKDSVFSVEEHAENKLALRFSSSEKTLECYPFEFVFRAVYTLNDNSLSVEYEVENVGDKTMYFAIGAHPGFALDDGSACKIDFHATRVKYVPLDGNLLSREVKIEDGNEIIADKAFFRRHNTFIAVRKNKEVTIIRKNYDVTVTSDSPLIALWADDERDNYVCVESWWGACDYAVRPVREISKKPYINALEKGKSDKFGYTITVTARQEK
ncbi:MAG: hypothetical protein ACI4SC_00805 [Candidatus Neoclostridium sp.]